MDTTQKLSLLHGLSPLFQSVLSNSLISSLREEVVVEQLGLWGEILLPQTCW